MADDGNILDDNTAYLTEDSSGWEVVTNLVEFDTTTMEGLRLSLGGGSPWYEDYCLYLGPVTAAEPSTARTALSYPVVPGAHYELEAYMLHLMGTGDATVSFRWYDDADTFISATDTVLSIPQVFNNKTWTVLTEAPAGAAACRLEYSFTSVTLEDRLYVAAMYLYAIYSPDNLLTYDESTNEDALPDWTPTNATLDRTTEYPIDGNWAMSVTPTAPELIDLQLARMIPVAAGQGYRISTDLGFVVPDNQTSVVYSTLLLDWLAADGTLIPHTPAPFVAAEADEAGYVDFVLDITDVAPEGAAYVTPHIKIDHSLSSTIAAYYIDASSLVPSTPDYVAVTDNDDGYVSLDIAWPDDPQHPRDGSMTVRRIGSDGDAQYVRGYGGDIDHAPFTGDPYVVEDYEAPLGQMVWYLISWWNADGSKASDLYTTYIQSPTLPDPNYVWVKSPGLPAWNVTAMVEAPPAWTMAARHTLYEIVDRSTPVERSDVRASRSGSLQILVWERDDSEQFESLMRTGLPVLFQSMPGFSFAENCYCSVGDVGSENLTGADNRDGWRWTLDIREMDRPLGGIQGSAGVTWQDLFDQYDTWLDVFDAPEFGSWADVLTKLQPTEE